MQNFKGRRGPKVEPEMGELKTVTVKLDEATLERLRALDKNRSRAVRAAVRLAYEAYQSK